MANKNTSEENPCPNCGGTSFAWGVVRPDGGGAIDFIIGQSFFEQVTKNLAARKVKGRHCKSCGNLQLFVKD